MSATSFGSLRKAVTTAGTRVALSATSLVVRSFKIRANTGNTGFIYLGDSSVSSTTGFELDDEDVYEFICPSGKNINEIDLSTVYIDSSVNGEGVTVFWMK